MTDRVLSSSRWLFAALFLSIPITAFAFEVRSLDTAYEVGFVLFPWVLVGLGLAFKVPAARGLAIGFSGLCVVTFLAVHGTDASTDVQAVALAHSLGLLLALPAFGRVFQDSARLRWTAAMMGVAIPAAMLFAVTQSGAAQTFGFGALALIGVGAIGLAFQRTWSLLVLLVAALSVVFATLTSNATAFEMGPLMGVGYFAAGALGATLLPWVAPVLRKLATAEA